MTTGLLVILTLGALVGGWTVLSLFGAERSRRMNELEARRRAAAAAIPLLRVPSPSASADPSRRPTSPRKPKPGATRNSSGGKGR